MSLGAQKMKTRPDDLSTAENESGTENMKVGPEALGTDENDYGSATH
jgi:hypothetical protein